MTKQQDSIQQEISDINSKHSPVALTGTLVHLHIYAADHVAKA